MVHFQHHLQITMSVIFKQLYFDSQNSMLHQLSSVCLPPTQPLFQPTALLPCSDHSRQGTEVNKNAEIDAQGVLLFYQQKFEEAANLFRQLIEINPFDFGSWNNLGLALIRQKKPQLCGEALFCFRKATEIRPHYFGGFNNIGITFAMLNQFEQAMQCLKIALRCDPANISVFCNVGFILFEAALLKENPNSIQQIVHEYGFDGCQQNVSLALQCFRRATQLDPHCWQAFLGIGKIQEMTGNWQAAIENFGKAKQIMPGDERSHHCLGSLHFKLQQYEEAAICFREAFRINSLCVLNFKNLVSCLCLTRTRKRAVQLFQLKSGQFWLEDCPQIFQKIAITMIQLGLLEKSLGYFRKAFLLQPQNQTFRSNYQNILYNLASKAEAKQQWEKSQEYYRIILAINPRHLQTRLHLSRIQFTVHQHYETALQSLLTIVRENPEACEAYLMLGEIIRSEISSEQRNAIWMAIICLIQTHPNNPVAMMNLFFFFHSLPACQLASYAFWTAFDLSSQLHQLMQPFDWEKYQQNLPKEHLADLLLHKAIIYHNHSGDQSRICFKEMRGLFPGINFRSLVKKIVQRYDQSTKQKYIPFLFKLEVIRLQEKISTPSTHRRKSRSPPLPSPGLSALAHPQQQKIVKRKVQHIAERKNLRSAFELEDFSFHNVKMLLEKGLIETRRQQFSLLQKTIGDENTSLANEGIIKEYLAGYDEQVRSLQSLLKFYSSLTPLVHDQKLKREFQFVFEGIILNFHQSDSLDHFQDELKKIILKSLFEDNNLPSNNSQVQSSIAFLDEDSFEKASGAESYEKSSSIQSSTASKCHSNHSNSLYLKMKKIVLEDFLSSEGENIYIREISGSVMKLSSEDVPRQIKLKYQAMLWSNYLSLLKYLAHQTMDLNIQHIARHFQPSPSCFQPSPSCFQPSPSCFQPSPSPFETWSLRVEKGNADFIPQDSICNYKYVQYLKKQGTAQIISWLTCFLKGILELQFLGVFHQDLAIRNTIKTGPATYKIIDFDLAFKVDLFQGQHPSHLAGVEKLIICWLELPPETPYESYLLSLLFRVLDPLGVQGLNSLKMAQIIKKERTTTESKVARVLTLLRQYMLISHKQRLLQITSLFLGSFPEHRERHLFQLMRGLPVSSREANQQGYNSILAYLPNLQ